MIGSISLTYNLNNVNPNKNNNNYNIKLRIFISTSVFYFYFYFLNLWQLGMLVVIPTTSKWQNQNDWELHLSCNLFFYYYYFCFFIIICIDQLSLDWQYMKCWNITCNSVIKHSLFLYNLLVKLLIN